MPTTLQVADPKAGKRWVALEVDTRLAGQFERQISGDRAKADKIGTRLEGMLRKIVGEAP